MSSEEHSTNRDPCITSVDKDYALSILLSCTTSGIHLVLWPGDQRSWVDRKGMTVCQVKSWTVSVQAQASGRWRAGWQRGACGQGLCSHLSWQPLRAALPSLCCQTSSLSLRVISASELFLFWLLLPGSHSKQKAQKQSPAFSDAAGSWLAPLKDLWGWVFTLRLLF